MTNITETPPAHGSGSDGPGRARRFSDRTKELLKDETRTLLEERGINEQLANRMDRYGETVAMLRGRVQNEGGTRIASYLEDMALRADRVSDRLRQGDYSGAGHELREMAEDHPEIFLGVAFAIGTVLGRIAREVLIEQEKKGTAGQSDDASTGSTSGQGVPAGR